MADNPVRSERESTVRRIDMENQSMTTKMLPEELVRSVMKSSAMCDQEHWGVGNNISLPASRVLGTLA